MNGFGGATGGYYDANGHYARISFQSSLYSLTNLGSLGPRPPSEQGLTGDRKARVEMEISGHFAPFRSDADCILRPQSLIGEKFVQCHPGTPRGRPLVAQGGHAPTVPLARTHSPVDLDLIFAALRRPYRERLTILVNELGTGLAGRPKDL